ncbi:acyltransferase [Leptospira gomenensis]|uniref:Acyltransferase n=1 Tax=Leptospira gomenensis TaxID=2484974 RepID=A0A5F1YDZ5_9LEPT|nr:acyltransferase [Leptospira gomenensis]TGK33246.1 acyltransferase [Leptospira gomenensis]TGK35522.1 acyltransferase [Leptospira gomenensis]TGK40845.1 acyltransferase [Leptospira gomenensis]TGK61136.1 acyltransferase [Leptospira gomenensis]
MKSYIRKLEFDFSRKKKSERVSEILRRPFRSTSFFLFVSLTIFVPDFRNLNASDPLDPDLQIVAKDDTFPFYLGRIRFPQKAEIRSLGNGGHWRAVPTQGRAWMLILREWENQNVPDQSLKKFFRELFPDSKDLPAFDVAGWETIGGEKKETVSGNPLTIRYYLFRRGGKIVSIYLCFDSENALVSEFFANPSSFLRTTSSSNSF